VGTVYIATSVAGDIRVEHVPQRGNRASVRDKTVIAALLQLYRHLHDVPV
jgi:nicotinamide mononucleotide (NMN) deamidase PncC